MEIFFGIFTRQAIRRGTFGSVRELIEAIGAFINGWNERCQPFAWIKDADLNLYAVLRELPTLLDGWTGTCRTYLQPFLRHDTPSAGHDPTRHYQLQWPIHSAVELRARHINRRDVLKAPLDQGIRRTEERPPHGREFVSDVGRHNGVHGAGEDPVAL